LFYASFKVDISNAVDKSLPKQKRNIIKPMAPREIGWEGVDWMHLTQDRDW